MNLYLDGAGVGIGPGATPSKEEQRLKGASVNCALFNLRAQRLRIWKGACVPVCVCARVVPPFSLLVTVASATLPAKGKGGHYAHARAQARMHPSKS